MSEIIKRDPERDRGGRFVKGGIPGPGRPKGARSKLGEAFLVDLAQVWEEAGIDALRRCAKEEPAAFVRVIAGLLPKDININATVGVNVGDFLDTFRVPERWAINRQRFRAG